MAAILLLAMFTLTLAFAIPPVANAENVSAWTSTTAYSKSLSDSSCAIYSGTMYCVGGVVAGTGSSRVFYGPVTSTGVTSWTETTDYGGTGTSGSTGVKIKDESCAIAKGTIYCVGGVNSTGLTTEVWYGPVTSTGVTSWTETTDYAGTGTVGATGLPVWLFSCSISSAVRSYIYCVGGSTTGGSPVSQVWYAQVTSSGVGTWTETTDYGAPSTSDNTGATGLQIVGEGCVTNSGFIYCAAGEDVFTGAGYNATYFAPVSGTGVGVWTETTDYGSASISNNAGTHGVPTYFQSCVAAGGYMYCIGGRGLSTYSNGVYYAPLSSSGIGAWTAAANYGGGSLASLSCAATASDIYCVGGANPTATSAAYYGAIAAPVPVFPYGVLPFLLIIPALYYVVSRRHAGKAAPAPSMGGK